MNSSLGSLTSSWMVFMAFTVIYSIGQKQTFLKIKMLHFFPFHHFHILINHHSPLCGKETQAEKWSVSPKIFSYIVPVSHGNRVIKSLSWVSEFRPLSILQIHEIWSLSLQWDFGSSNLTKWVWTNEFDTSLPVKLLKISRVVKGRTRESDARNPVLNHVKRLGGWSNQAWW